MAADKFKKKVCESGRRRLRELQLDLVTMFVFLAIQAGRGIYSMWKLKSTIEISRTD